MIHTGYGKMAIEEYAPGKVRMVRGGVVGTRREGVNSSCTPNASSARQSKDRGGNGQAGSNPAPSHSDQYDSKLEASRFTYLSYLLLAKDIKRIVHHPFTVLLSEKRTYTPDFLIEFPDGRLQVEEVKGSSKQKNARDSITRLHLAAAKLPMFDWRLTMRVKGQWEEKCIPTSL